MKCLIVVFVALIGTAAADDYDDKWTAEEIQQIFSEGSLYATAPTPELIAKNHYPVEVHEVTTDDGYILQMHRIPGSPTNPPAPGKPIVFIMHGLYSTSSDWILSGPGKSLGYILADAGYDVWLGNARGNTYSRHHTTIVDDLEFYSFSWHEIGFYDVPAMIDFALATTGQKNLVYIGHSQGTSVFFVLMSQRPDYNAKIKTMFALAPIAYIGHLRSPVLRLAALSTNTLADTFFILGVYGWDLSPRLIRAARAAYCENDPLSQSICSYAIFLFGGFNKAQLNVSLLPSIVGHTPAGGATRQIAHYGQEIQSHRFRQYDYGIIKNLLIYGSISPPDYDLSLVTAPVHLVYGENDLLSIPEDVLQLANELGNLTEVWRVADKKWSHFDFTWGIDANTVIYEPIVERLKKLYND